MARKSKRRSWIVKVRKTAIMELVVDDCTEEQARKDPYKYLVSADDAEQEIDTKDLDVLDVRPNE